MCNKEDLELLKEQIIAEYLADELSLRKLEAKYGICYTKIHRWILRYQGREKKSPRVKKVKKTRKVFAQEQEVLPKDVMQLQGELRKAKLHNALLTELIDIAEKDLGIAIRKKSGTKRS